MSIPEYEVVDFNRQSDELREKLLNDSVNAHKAGKPKMAGRIIDVMNQMELARRVFNTFAETGKVEIPE